MVIAGHSKHDDVPSRAPAYSRAFEIASVSDICSQVGKLQKTPTVPPVINCGLDRPWQTTITPRRKGGNR
jgi:hypothetical protein